MAKIAFLGRADNDILRIYAECEAYREGRGDQFSAEVEQHLRLLERLPHLGRKIGDPYLRLKLSHFSYSLIYTVEGSRVLIHTIASTYESLDSILRRLRG